MLPACCVPRRRDSAASVVKALTSAAPGLGHRRIAGDLGVPAATVRGWLRRARHNAERLRQAATVAAGRYDVSVGPIGPRGSPLADAVEALGVAAAAVVCRGLFPRPPAPAALVVMLTRGQLLVAAR